MHAYADRVDFLLDGPVRTKGVKNGKISGRSGLSVFDAIDCSEADIEGAHSRLDRAIERGTGALRLLRGVGKPPKRAKCVLNVRVRLLDTKIGEPLHHPEDPACDDTLQGIVVQVPRLIWPLRPAPSARTSSGGHACPRTSGIRRSAQGDKVFLTGLAPGGTGEESVARDAQLGTNEIESLLGNDFTGFQKMPRVVQDAELKREAQLVFPPSAHPDMFDVIICQRVVLQKGCLVSWHVE